MRMQAWFRPDPERYEGVRPINIYLLRLLFLLVVVFVGYDSWSSLLTHQGAWDHVRAAAVCMWGAFALLSIIGVLYPLKMLPLVLFEIIYKVVWLIIVAYPLWMAGELAGSPAEEMTVAFLWVLLPIIAMPWGYFVRTYVLNRKLTVARSIGAAA
jgi:hypothetical protein